MQIRQPTPLTPITATYKDVCGSNNPWTGAPNVNAYGADAATYNSYMLALYDTLPVMNDYNKLRLQIVVTLTANAPKYAAMYRAQTAAAVITDITSNYNYTVIDVREGADTDHIGGTEIRDKSGSITDSGTGGADYSGDATDSKNTYDNATLRAISKTETSNETTTTHQNTTTYNHLTDTKSFNQRQNEHEYGSTFTKTVSGYNRTTPAEMLKQYADFAANNNVFLEIIRDVVKDISCIIYIPALPENDEEV